MSDTNSPWLERAAALFPPLRMEPINEHLKVLDGAGMLVRERCQCDTNPSTFDGPVEDCPMHGRPYGEWVKYVDRLARENQRLVDLIDQGYRQYGIDLRNMVAPAEQETDDE